MTWFEFLASCKNKAKYKFTNVNDGLNKGLIEKKCHPATPTLHYNYPTFPYSRSMTAEFCDKLNTPGQSRKYNSKVHTVMILHLRSPKNIYIYIFFYCLFMLTFFIESNDPWRVLFMNGMHMSS